MTINPSYWFPQWVNKARVSWLWMMWCYCSSVKKQHLKRQKLKTRGLPQLATRVSEHEIKQHPVICPDGADLCLPANMGRWTNCHFSWKSPTFMPLKPAADQHHLRTLFVKKHGRRVEFVCHLLPSFKRVLPHGERNFIAASKLQKLCEQKFVLSDFNLWI